ncbi:MAG: N-acetylmuramoyl-L-alanine amidase [Clostridiales bacterium]|nr:N-acetylmuramoyl-L-alanine amidase [Clostridiales bacterium]
MSRRRRRQACRWTRCGGSKTPNARTRGSSRKARRCAPRRSRGSGSRHCRRVLQRSSSGIHKQTFRRSLETARLCRCSRRALTRCRHPYCRNANSIGVELCDAKRDGRVMATDKTLQNAAELVYQLCKQYKIPYDHIIRHYDVTGKLCPAYWVKGDGLQKFRKQVEEVGEVVEKSYMIVDGKKVEVNRILKGGTNYVKVRDIAKALDLEVGFQGNIATLKRK